MRQVTAEGGNWTREGERESERDGGEEDVKPRKKGTRERRRRKKREKGERGINIYKRAGAGRHAGK